MDRIGAIKDFARSQQKRPSLVAPVPSILRRLAAFIVLVGAVLMLAFSRADASSFPPTITVSFSLAGCEYTGDLNRLADACNLSWTQSSNNIYFLSIDEAAGRVKYVYYSRTDGIWYPAELAYLPSWPYTVLSRSCPYGYSLVANMCDIDTDYQTSVDFLRANIGAIQNTLNNQSTLAAAAFDPALAGEFFAWGFTGLMLVGFAAWAAGQLLGFINRVLH